MAKMTIKTNFHDNLAPFSQRKEAKLLNAKVAKCQGYIMAGGRGQGALGWVKSGRKRNFATDKLEGLHLLPADWQRKRATWQLADKF